ncbi:MAG: J domain-containing protein [Chloroflexi bacterium]|jgi:curved DNA-binding protein CbpA|nr:J domain-containing protein [Chloroflexota bacterium]MBA3959767.1 J domain-containing protein [Chloroflexota bacterium]
MPDPTFRGDPYAVLGLSHIASSVDIKRRWRELAREHHPDRAAGDGAETEKLTTRMARINAAYDLLRDPLRRARYDASPQARRTRETESRGFRPDHGEGRDGQGIDGAGGPPPPPVARPVTARFDTSAVFHRRNATSGQGPAPLAGHPPMGRRQGDSDLRASIPTGPVERRLSEDPPRLPTLREARETVIEFGRFHGFTLGDVAGLEPTYIDWIAKTITRDRDLVMRARVIQADLNERGIERVVRERAGTSAAG